MKPVLLFCFRGLLTLCLALPLVSCSQHEPSPDTVSLYDEAARLGNQKKYPEALALYDQALGADTLKGFSQTALEALCQKNRIEFLTGRYSGAFRTWDAIRRHDGGKLPDSLHNAAALDTGRMYAELGMYGKAASVMASLRNPDAWQRFNEARLLFRAGKIVEAARIYSEFSASGDAAIKMTALSGILDCALLDRVAGLDAPDNIAGKIAMVSGRVMKMDSPPEVKVRALRIAAKSLQQMEKQRPNASYLLFRALAVAQEAGFGRLVPILQFESNNIIVRKPDTWRSVIEYFGQRNMPFEKTAALFMLGRSVELTPAERIEAYRLGLTACRHYGIPATASGYVALEREAAGELGDLLTAGGRYIELFDASALADYLEQQRMVQMGIAGFRLPPGNEAVQNEIIELNRDISGLLQRKIMMTEEGAGFMLANLVDKVIREKQGRLIALIADAARVDGTVPARLQPRPVTLNTLRKSLRPGEALIRVSVGDSLSTVMLVSAKEMQIITSTVPGEQLRSRFVALRQRLASAGPNPAAALAADENRRWLTATLLQSMEERLSGYRHLIFVSRQAEPFHLLGSGAMLGSDHQVSWVVSTGEALMHAAVQPQGDVLFFDASRPEKAGIYKLFHPGDRVFLSWKPMPESEISSLKSLMKPGVESAASGSESLKNTGRKSGSPTSQAWMWLTPYGSE
ncbi:tetratricopeptide repeat protein [Chlorobaculum sp. 24CR]|uniref:tetratricopeptide repeat protein n=1 Tax=Chlorobaculum sp. 24CR TaxID=2508878 RepID=UPI00100ABF49|nr:tetratricopeptide repeat protein [Chlorobaculum sp. 24CR]RXK82328.1 tetratricopeptide repeat protein [Chlorobaculum sp. 24CR]